jgi:hypothetical protein
MALAISITYAVTKYTLNIPNTATIAGYEMKLWRVDTNAIVTSIAWGSVESPSVKTSDMVFSFTEQLAIKNTGDYAYYVAWDLNATTPLPAGVTLQCACVDSVTHVSNSWNKLSYSEFGSIPPNTVSVKRLNFVLTIASDVPRQPITFGIILLAADTSSG